MRWIGRGETGAGSADSFTIAVRFQRLRGSAQSGRRRRARRLRLWTKPRSAAYKRRDAGTVATGGAQVAQLVEHVTENHGVGGSIPPLGTIHKSKEILNRTKTTSKTELSHNLMSMAIL